jgi:hypothetical protein
MQALRRSAHCVRETFVGDGPCQGHADLLLGGGNDRGQPVAVIRVAPQGGDMGDELAALMMTVLRRPSQAAVQASVVKKPLNKKGTLGRDSHVPLLRSHWKDSKQGPEMRP